MLVLQVTRDLLKILYWFARVCVIFDNKSGRSSTVQCTRTGLLGAHSARQQYEYECVLSNLIVVPGCRSAVSMVKTLMQNLEFLHHYVISWKFTRIISCIKLSHTRIKSINNKFKLRNDNIVYTFYRSDASNAANSAI